ncbi:hypothetical protein EDD17DRAFT_1763329 [Pisolithus thermaeus]|nr:hypothetical protein EDD17DRAFT_1763329 [Pisolithus thermaeus]
MATATQTPVIFLPTLQRLGSTVDPTIDVQGIANAWDYHTYEGRDRVKRFLTNQLPKFSPSTLKLREDLVELQTPFEDLVELQTPFEDLVWTQDYFTFDTTVGHASGIFRLVPLANGSWKGHMVFTNLEDLRGFPEKIRPSGNPEEIHGKSAEARKREQEHLDEEPSVIVVGGGQSGLDAAARLKALDVNVLIIERNERIGDNWRNRYAALCLRDPVWYDHTPYLPFPPNWPIYTPALKLADWLESYAHVFELKVWTSTRVVTVEPGTKGRKWSVKVVRGDGRERVFKVNHVVFALGISSDTVRMLNVPCREEFTGQVLHSSKHKGATDHLGKKVVVVDACTSAHDIRSDYADHSVDVMMVQRSCYAGAYGYPNKG